MGTGIRRSRMRRTRTGKRIELTARDTEIFRLLARYRYLPSTYVHAFVGGTSETRFKERLGDLFHEAYLDRPERQWEMADCRHRPVVHELGVGAQRVLDEHGIVEQSRTWLGASAHRQFSHALLICEVLASIELGIRAHADLRFIAWPEILAKAPVATQASSLPFRFPVSAPTSDVVPDGIFGIEYANGEKKSFRFFALEIDRGTMPVERSNPNQTSYLGKLAAYSDVILKRVYKSHMGIPNLLVLTVTTSVRHGEEIMGRVATQIGECPAFLFKSVAARSRPIDEVTTPWLRASGLPAVSIMDIGS